MFRKSPPGRRPNMFMWIAVHAPALSVPKSKPIHAAMELPQSPPWAT
jgi:hypothetical protein